MILRIRHPGHAGCKPLLAAGLCRILAHMLSPSSHLDVLSVTCPVGELQTPQDSHHVLYFHVGRPVSLTCRLGGREQYGGVHHPGDLCVLPAGVVGQWDMGARADSLVLRLSPSLVQETAHTLRLTMARAKVAPAIRVRDPHLEHIGWLLRSEREAGYPFGQLFVDSLAAAMAARLLRRQGHSPPASRCQLPKWRLHAVADYIEANLDRDLSLAELAAVAGFSVPHFKVLFRRTTGLSPHRYVVERRVERARQLLLKCAGSMGDVALDAGFTHSSHMVRCFRRVLGITPVDVTAFSRPQLEPITSNRLMIQAT
jgi:AraC family transcriptional regulator